MERNIQKIGLINWIILLIASGVALMTARMVESPTSMVGVIFLGIGFLVSAVSYFQMRLAERESLEQLDFEALKQSRNESALFGETDAELFPARRSRVQFDRVIVPIFTVILCLAQGAAAIWAWFYSQRDFALAYDKITLSMATFSLLALILFLLGKYSAGLARLEKQILLRPSASYLLLGALISFLITLVGAALWFQYPMVDVYVSRVLCVVLGLVSLETLLTVIFEIYRPRVKGQITRVLYESRLIGLLGQPGGLIKTAAQALDYQFGFKVSETWFYQFLERAIAWIVLVQIVVLLLSTSILIIEPHEQAVLERFGKPVAGREILEPGLHFKLPFPIDQVHRYSTREIQNFYVGFIPDEERGEEKILLWTVSHYKEEFNMLVASREDSGLRNSEGEQAVPVNFLSVNIPIQFQINDLKKWAYGHSQPKTLLEGLATREVTRYLISVDIDEIMSEGRQRAASALRNRIQERADAYGLGVTIVLVGLQDIHPPIGSGQAKVAASYEEVIQALQMKETSILRAEGYASELIPKAEAEAQKVLFEAEAYRVSKIAEARALAGQFTSRLEAFKASPDVFKARTHLQALAKALDKSRKYVVMAPSEREVVIMNLEDKLRPDLTDVVLEDEKK